MSDLTTAAFVLAGVLAGQVSAIVKTVSSGRRRKQETEERRVEVHEAKVRPLYETLIEAINHMRINLAGLRDAYAAANQDSPVFGGLGEAFGEHPAKLLSAAASIRIDGSDEASRVACNIMDLIGELEAKVRREVPGIQAILTDLIAALTKAESELIELARQDFGAGRAKPGRRVLLWRSRASSHQIASS